MKYLFFLSIFFSLAASAHDPFYKEITKTIEDLPNNFVSSPSSCCLVTKLGGEKENLFIRAQETHKNAFRCLDALSFEEKRARSSWSYCRPLFGQSAYSCSENEKDLIKMRMEDATLMEKITNFTKETFNHYKKELRDKCCSDTMKACLNRFNKVELKITNDSTPSAQYVSDSAPIHFRYNAIELTTGKLASQYTEEGLERVLLHEFGHVCQFAKISEDEKAYKTFTSPTSNCSLETGQMGFKFSDLKSLECVNKKLEHLSKTVDPKNFCFGKWYREAFADMIFRDKMNTIYHWIYDMHRTKPSRNYGSVLDYIQCDMEHFPEEKTCNK